MSAEEDIVVASVERDGVVVTCDPPARFRPVITRESELPWPEPPFWSVADNEFLLTPRAEALDDLPRACESALWNLGAVVLGDGLDDVLSDPVRIRMVPPELLGRAALLRRRLRVTRRPAPRL